jgi:transcriptional regulator with GAF, ATPase, and Fis domain
MLSEGSFRSDHRIDTVARDEPTTRVRRGGAATVPFARPRLVVIAGQDFQRIRRITACTTSIGSGKAADFRLGDPLASRLHCEIRLDGAEAHVVDLGSRNGTFVDGVRVQQAVLVAGSTLRIGDTQILVEADPEFLDVEVSTRACFGGLLGTSLAMRRLYATLGKLAAGDGTILLVGETGTGKELVARSIHEASSRSSRPFVTVDCGAFAEALAEADLFGHVRGAFTGATGDRRGLLEEADGGTIFLDDVGELPAAIQPKLLRVLETRSVRRIGDSASRRLDVRIIASTKSSLAAAVNDGIFREDLYYRLAVLEVAVPPLRDRRDDIPLLAQAFHDQIAATSEPLPRDVVAALVGRAWPGNVRQLRNVVERGVTVGWTGEERPRPPANSGAPAPAFEVPTSLPLREARIVWTEQLERVYLGALLERTRGNVTKAAALAGLKRRSLQRLLAQLGIASEAVRRELGV